MTDIETSPSLTAARVAAVDDLVREATAADRVAPLNEEAELHLHDSHASDVLHVRASAGDRLVGYALAAGDPRRSPVVLECVVHPAHRRRGIGRSLVQAIADRSDRAELRAWAHGDLPGAAELAAASGFERVRVLLRMEVHLVEPLAAAPAPPGVTIRAFRPGADDAAWLALNARAFADHPEQGSMTPHDLDARKAADWFDPAGFFLAERDGELIGFHWTKMHAGDQPVGEVYVVGIDPSAQGTGLGSALTREGLVYLQRSGIRTVELYVEGDNAPALSVYRRLGFTDAARDVMYARRG